jgi:hypothetical protein
MKKIIDGKRYDTATADVIAINSFGYSGDFRHFKESLYRTKRGTWFLAGYGGPMTKYARQVDTNATSGGENIFPLSPDEAREWLENVGDTAAIEEHFPVEDA